jgi:hypothetical protein
LSEAPETIREGDEEGIMMTPTKRALAAAVVAAVALLAAVRPHNPSTHQLKEVVTHRICYTDIDGNKTCE